MIDGARCSGWAGLLRRHDGRAEHERKRREDKKERKEELGGQGWADDSSTTRTAGPEVGVEAPLVLVLVQVVRGQREEKPITTTTTTTTGSEHARTWAICFPSFLFVCVGCLPLAHSAAEVLCGEARAPTDTLASRYCCPRTSRTGLMLITAAMQRTELGLGFQLDSHVYSEPSIQESFRTSNRTRD